jgi:hypothetical protein
MSKSSKEKKYRVDSTLGGGGQMPGRTNVASGVLGEFSSGDTDTVSVQISFTRKSEKNDAGSPVARESLGSSHLVRGSAPHRLLHGS